MFLRFPLACLEPSLAQGAQQSPPGTHPHAPSLCSPTDGSCVRRCGPGFYGDPELGQCERCHPACETCTGFGYQQCSSCREGQQLRQGTCAGPAQVQVEGRLGNGMCGSEREREQVSSHLLCRSPSLPL